MTAPEAGDMGGSRRRVGGVTSGWKSLLDICYYWARLYGPSLGEFAGKDLSPTSAAPFFR